MKKQVSYWLTTLACIALLATGCKKDSKPVPPPTVSTVAATAITTTSATAGGTASGEGITEVGLFYSKTQTNPDGSDGKMPGALQNGSFSVNLSGLQAGSTYYIRAYATNASGTSFGNTLSFMTGNAGPEAKSVKIAGDKTIGSTLTATYSYSDNENDPESGSTLQWYAANDTIGATVTPINGATAASFIITSDLKDKFIRVGVTPKASSGTTPGVEGKSYWLGPIGGEGVTFMYNGKSVTYGIITSSVTGKKWLDRNLGAPNTPNAYDDWANYGDQFQWGRAADGHQLIKRGATSEQTSAVNGTTPTPFAVAAPNSSLFVVTTTDPHYWTTAMTNQLWDSNSTNNPCPSGWHVPTKAEWQAEIDGSQMTNFAGSFNQLKLTFTGYRDPNNGIVQAGGIGYYWSTTPLTDPGFENYVYRFRMNSGGNTSVTAGSIRTNGFACRCIKNP